MTSTGKNRMIRLLAGILLAAGLCLMTAGCGTDDIDISGYEDQTILLTGVGDEDIRVSVGELKGLDCITKKTKSTSDKIGTVRATGPTLETLLAGHGSSQKDWSSIRIWGRDGYDAKISGRILAEDDIILAFGIDGKPLDEESAPVRIIIPESDSAYWIRMVEKIEFVK